MTRRVNMVNFVDWFGFNRADANKDGGSCPLIRVE